MLLVPGKLNSIMNFILFLCFGFPFWTLLLQLSSLPLILKFVLHLFTILSSSSSHLFMNLFYPTKSFWGVLFLSYLSKNKWSKKNVGKWNVHFIFLITLSKTIIFKEHLAEQGKTWIRLKAITNTFFEQNTSMKTCENPIP